LFFLINAYTARLSPTVVANLLAELLGSRGGTITAGEVGLSIERDGKVLPVRRSMDGGRREREREPSRS
jgi:23S rRNA (cytosine1962-C5)-methyltransferase